jgi:hypothetical protein
MSQMRLGATCLLVRTMLWDWQVGQARVQVVRGNGEDDSLSECPRAQSGPFWVAFFQAGSARPTGGPGLRTLPRQHLDARQSGSGQTRIHYFGHYVSFHQLRTCPPEAMCEKCPSGLMQRSKDG